MGFRREREVQSSVIARPHPDLAEASSNAVAAGDGQAPAAGAGVGVRLGVAPAGLPAFDQYRLSTRRVPQILGPCRAFADGAHRGLGYLRIDLAEFLGPLVSETLDPGEVGRFRSAPRLVPGSSFDATVAVKGGVLCRTGQGH